MKALRASNGVQRIILISTTWHMFGIGCFGSPIKIQSPFLAFNSTSFPSVDTILFIEVKWFQNSDASYTFKIDYLVLKDL